METGLFLLKTYIEKCSISKYSTALMLTNKNSLIHPWSAPKLNEFFSNRLQLSSKLVQNFLGEPANKQTNQPILVEDDDDDDDDAIDL